MTLALPYTYRWNRQGRKGQPCAIPIRGTMNSCLVVFADGYAMVTSRNAIMRRKADCEPCETPSAASTCDDARAVKPP